MPVPARSALPPVIVLLVVLGACGAAGDGRAAVNPGVGSEATVSPVPDSVGDESPPTAVAPASSAAASTLDVSPSTESVTTSTAADGSGSTAPTPTTTTTSTSTTDAPEASDEVEPIVMRLRIERRVDDAATDGFAAFVRTVLADERGWTRAGFEFVFDDADFDYTVVLAEGAEVDRLCLPYDTFGRFSCQIGPVVALNADRWRTAVDDWPASLDEYRTMLVNHEVGHLLGQHHPASRCPGEGQPAPVMAQQSSGVAPCVANPWPLPWEISCALQRVEPLAPPFERDITLTCGPDGPLS